MNDKAFIAQNQLELKQRHEHGEMFRYCKVTCPYNQVEIGWDR